MKKIIMLLSLLSCSIYEDFAQNKVSDFYERTYPPILESCTASPVMARLFSYDAGLRSLALSGERMI